VPYTTASTPNRLPNSSGGNATEFLGCVYFACAKNRINSFQVSNGKFALRQITSERAPQSLRVGPCPIPPLFFVTKGEWDFINHEVGVANVSEG